MRGSGSNAGPLFRRIYGPKLRSWLAPRDPTSGDQADVRTSRMRVEIYSSEKVIGSAELNQLDPPMGVAVGLFTPTSEYVAAIHAGEIDGHENGAAIGALSVHSAEGKVGCEGVWIADFQNTLSELQVSVLGIADFATYFADHPDFRKYWGLD